MFLIDSTYFTTYFIVYVGFYHNCSLFGGVLLMYALSTHLFCRKCTDILINLLYVAEREMSLEYKVGVGYTDLYALKEISSNIVKLLRMHVKQIL